MLIIDSLQINFHIILPNPFIISSYYIRYLFLFLIYLISTRTANLNWCEPQYVYLRCSDVKKNGRKSLAEKTVVKVVSDIWLLIKGLYPVVFKSASPGRIN